MADNTIDTNSFFNQPEEGGGISAVKVLAQNAFDIATNIRAQFRDFVQSFDQYKLEAQENDRLISNTVSELDIQTDETDRTIEETIEDFNDKFKGINAKFKAIEDDISGQDKKIEAIESKVDQVSEVFFKFEKSQKAAAEKAADDAFRAEDAAQKEKGGKTAAGLGGLASMMGASTTPVGDDTEDPKDPKEKGLLERLKDNVWGLGMGAAGLTSALWSGAGDKLGGFTDWMTGGLTDFDKKGRGKLDLFDPISGGKDKKWGAESKIDIDSDLNEFPVKEEKGGFLSNFFGKKKDKEEDVETEVDNLESRIDALESGDPPPKDSKKTVTKRKVKPHHYDMKTGKAYIDGEEVPLELYKEFKEMSPEEQLRDPRFSTGDPISPTEGTDEKGLEPKGEEGEKKEKGLFGGFFSGLSGKKKEEKPSGTESKSISTSESATMRGGKVVSGNMSQEDAEKNKQRLELESQRFQAISTYGYNSPEVNEIQKKIMVLGGTPEEAIYTDKEGNLKTKGYSTFGGKTTVDEKGEGGGFKRAAGGFADFMTGGMFDFDKKNRKGSPKDFGIRRVAGGVADAMTGGLTDFDKRGSDNLQFGPIGGGKDKAWGSRNEQAKRGEKQSGMGIKRGIGGALDFATLGTFDFDKQNRKGSPKGWGIKRVAGGLADAITAGATDFDKRGTGIGQMKLGENMRRKKEKQKSIEAYNNNPAVIRMRKNEESIKNPFGNTTIKSLDGKELKQGDEGFEEALSNARKMMQSVPSPSGANFNQLSQQTEGDNVPEVLPVQMVEGDNTSSNYMMNKMMTDKGEFKNDSESAEGTYCPIGCINMMKANSTRQILV